MKAIILALGIGTLTGYILSGTGMDFRSILLICLFIGIMIGTIVK